MSVESEFLNHAAEKLEKYSERIEMCVSKLSPEQVWMRGSENQNAVANLMLHLNGNVTQWILSGIGGEPDRRIRNAEFDTRGGTEGLRLAAMLRETVNRAALLIRSLKPSRLTERATIQGYDVSLLEAIFNVVEHFSGHTAQIVFVTKMLTGEDLGFYSYLSKTGLRPADASTERA